MSIQGLPTQMVRAQSEPVEITADGRPAEQYGALQAFLGRQDAGWLPTWEVTAQQVEAAITEANSIATAHGVSVAWSEPYIDPVEYNVGALSAIVAKPARP